MINVPEWMWDVWEAGDFTGPNRPVTRATISKNILRTIDGTTYRSILFDQSVGYREIPNIQNVSITRATGADAAQMTLTMLNQGPIDPFANLDQQYDVTNTTAPTRRQLGDLGDPGRYTFRHGEAIDSSGENPWGHAPDPTWVDMIVPNRVVMVFQGYGTDGASRPSDDANLTLTGIFIIDDVQYSASGKITMSCRDLAKLLIEQRLYPPIIPLDKYPLTFESDHVEEEYIDIPEITSTSTTGTAASQGPNVAKHIASGYDSSVTPWYGYDGSVYGHKASHAFDGDQSTYWLSVGNSGPTVGWAFEWIGADCGGDLVNTVKFKPKWGGYVCYVAVKQNGVWQGSSVVPYAFTSEPAYPNDSNVKYIKKINIPSNEEWVTIDLGAKYNADQVRLVFTNLADSNLGTYQYRAAVYEMQAYLKTASTSATTTITTQEAFDATVEQFVEGNIDDYTDIVKLFCAWSGFYWPTGARDPVLAAWDPAANGRVWGDFMNSGAYPVDPWWISADYWDNKSVMDGINQLREILGFTFYVDHGGGIVWRPPNIWRTGNFVAGVGYIGQDSIRNVDETKVLIEYDATLNDVNLRSDIVVVSAEDPSIYGSWAPGVASGEGTVDISDLELLAGQHRVMLVSNYPFISKEEVDKFAYLVALRSHWSFRKSKFKIPGMPAFMPDDQVRIYERITSETYIHYLTGVTSTMDMTAGTWFMDVETHWLGNGPDREWAMSTGEMSPALFAYLRAIGQIPDEVEADQSLWPADWFKYSIPDLDLDPQRLQDYIDEIIASLPSITDIDVSDTTERDDDGWETVGSSAYNCGNAYRFEYWPDAGPLIRRPPGESTEWACNTGNLKYLTFMTKWLTAYGSWPPGDVPKNTFNGQTDTVIVKVDYRTVGAFKLLAQICAEEQLEVLLGQTGAYSCRPVYSGGEYSTTSWSNHAWGAALDINSKVFPQGYALPYNAAGNKLRNVVQRASSIRTNTTYQKVFVWGGGWSGSSIDNMHFEVCVNPLYLLEGVHE